jgi:hypothetical protein
MGDHTCAKDADVNSGSPLAAPEAITDPLQIERRSRRRRPGVCSSN